MKKFYFCEAINEELCFTKDYFIEEMKDRDLKELEVCEAVRELKSDYFYCKGIGEVCVKPPEGEPCGKSCDLYDPRNGKSGLCKEWRHCRTYGKEFVLTVDGKLKDNESFNNKKRVP